MVKRLKTDAQWERWANGRRHVYIVLDRATCDWVVDDQRDTAICRTHGEVADGVDSAHFPGWFWSGKPKEA